MPRFAFDIDTLIPHKRPMRLIDDVIDVSGDTARTTATVTPAWPTFAEGAVHALVLVELVAQTAAVVGGYKALTSPSDASVRKGMMVGIKRAEFKVDTLPLDTRLTIRATTRALLENFKEIQGVVMIDDEVVGEVSLQGVQVA